jgi:hypothetical protein
MPQLTFLPWLKVNAPERFGPVQLLPKQTGLEMLAGHDRAYADAMCAAYVEAHADKAGVYPQAPISFVTYRDQPLTTELAPLEFWDVGRALRLLGAVAQEPMQLGRSPSNCFVPIGQRYASGSFSLAIMSGKLESGGLDIQRARFTRPTYISMTAHLAIGEASLRASVEKLLDLPAPTKKQQALIRGIEWFFWANLDDDEQNSFVPFVLLLTAFESVLDLGHSSKVGFAKEMAKHLATPDDVLTTKVVAGHTLTLNEQGWWAYAFYAFRSDTVHGQALASAAYVYNGRSHFDLASRSFRILVRQSLLKMGLLALPLGIVGLALFVEQLHNPPTDDE